MKIQGTTINTPLARTAVVKDDIVSGKPWSSKNTIDKLCPTFTESGAVVTCEPVEGYPLEVEWKTKNLINPIAYMTGNDNSATTLNGDVFTSVTTNGSTYLNTGWGGKLETHPAGTYTVTVIPVSEGVNFFVVINSKASGTQLFYKKANASNGYTLTFTAKEEFYLQITGGDSTMWGTHSYKLQLEEGATATAYEPYAETATITRCGKNLFNYKDWIAYANMAYPSTNHVAGEIEYLGRKCFSYRMYRSNKDMFFTNIRFKPNTRYTAKMSMAMQYGSNTEQQIPAFLFIYTDGTNTYVQPDMAYRDKFVEITATSTAGKTISHLVIPNFSASGIVYIPIDSCVIMEGTTAEYAPYTGETFAQGEQIPAVQGINNLWADSGLLTVSGKADPVAKLEKLENAILTMGANV